jgi:4-oxalocrotonate tautomerase
MPHVIVKLRAGRSDHQKRALAQAVTYAISSALGSAEDSVSVANEDVQPSDWRSQIYEPDILGKPGTLIKKPGYGY